MPGCVVPTRYADPGPSRSPGERWAAPKPLWCWAEETQGLRPVLLYSFLAPASFQICVLVGGGRMGEDRGACGRLRSWGELSMGLHFLSAWSPDVFVWWLLLFVTRCAHRSWAAGLPIVFLSFPGGQRVTCGVDGFGRAAGMALTSLPPSLPPGRTPRPSRRSS